MTYNFIIRNNDININVVTHDMCNPSAVLIHIHGLGSHFQSDYDCMDTFINRVDCFQKNNIVSYGLELRGHGKSSGAKYYVDNFDDYLSDLDALIQYINLYHNNLPIYLLGFSMGGAIAIKYSIVFNNKQKIAGVILLSPLCGIIKNYSNIVISSMYYLSYLIPTWKLISNNNKLELYDIEYINNKVNSIYNNNNPHMLCIARECYNAVNWINTNLHLFNTPVIAFHSKNDTTTDYIKTQEFIEKCSSNDKKIIITNEGYHNLLAPCNMNDFGPNNIMKDISSWLYDRI